MQTARFARFRAPGYIWSDKVRNRIAGGEIAEAGFDNSLNFEKLVALKPDVVFLYGLTGKNAVTDKLHELGLKTVYIGDYVETTRSDAPNGSPYSENLPDDANWPARSLTASATNTTVRKHSSRASKNVPK